MTLQLISTNPRFPAVWKCEFPFTISATETLNIQMILTRYTASMHFLLLTCKNKMGHMIKVSLNRNLDNCASIADAPSLQASNDGGGNEQEEADVAMQQLIFGSAAMLDFSPRLFTGDDEELVALQALTSVIMEQLVTAAIVAPVAGSTVLFSVCLPPIFKPQHPSDQSKEQNNTLSNEEAAVSLNGRQYSHTQQQSALGKLLAEIKGRLRLSSSHK